MLPRVAECVVGKGVIALAHKAAGPWPNPIAKKTGSQYFFLVGSSPCEVLIAHSVGQVYQT